MAVTEGSGPDSLWLIEHDVQARTWRENDLPDRRLAAAVVSITVWVAPFVFAAGDLIQW